MSPLAKKHGRQLRDSLSRSYSSGFSSSSLSDAATLVYRVFVALLAVVCVSAGWACRGGGREEAFLAFSSSSSSPSRSSPALSLAGGRIQMARPTDTLVVYIFANSGKEGKKAVVFFFRFRCRRQATKKAPPCLLLFRAH